MEKSDVSVAMVFMKEATGVSGSATVIVHGERFSLEWF